MSESENTISAAIAAWLNAPPAMPAESPDGFTALLLALVPAVPVAVGQKMLGDKARSEMYREAANGRLEFLKDNNKTLVATRSILAYQRANFKPFAIAKLEPPKKRGRRR
jgi:hypothetical protein